jgi:hypothetical protein
MTERRRHPRLRTYIGAQIVFNQRRSVLDCLVRNLTAEGARVEFTNTALVPEAFDLVLPHRDETHHVRVRWRARDVAGVAIESQDARSLEARRIRALEEELLDLRRRNAEREARL